MFGPLLDYRLGGRGAQVHVATQDRPHEERAQVQDRPHEPAGVADREELIQGIAQESHHLMGQIVGRHAALLQVRELVGAGAHDLTQALHVD